jgi:hypothetical protein
MEVLDVNWIVGNLQNALDTWNGKLSEIYMLVTQSPADFKGGAIWNIILNINGALQAIGLALLVLFFVVGVARTCTNFSELKRPEQALKLFLRFAIAKGIVTYGLELMLAVFKIIQGIVTTIMAKSSFQASAMTLPQSIIDAINKGKNTMNNEKRFECDVVVMPGAELDTDICITGNVYMEKGSNANGYDIDVGESFFANHADFFNVHAGEDFSITRSIGNDVRVEGDVILKDICVLGDVFANGNVSISPNSSVWDVSAMGTVEVQVDVHAQNIMALEKIFKDVKSDAKKLQSKQVEFYLSVS